MDVFGFIGVIYPQEISPEVWQFPPGTLCLCRPTNAVFELVTMYILTIDVFETPGIHKKLKSYTGEWSKLQY
jgi:hypothetical protein